MVAALARRRSHRKWVLEGGCCGRCLDVGRRAGRVRGVWWGFVPPKGAAPRASVGLSDDDSQTLYEFSVSILNSQAPKFTEPATSQPPFR